MKSLSPIALLGSVATARQFVFVYHGAEEYRDQFVSAVEQAIPADELGIVLFQTPDPANGIDLVDSLEEAATFPWDPAELDRYIVQLIDLPQEPSFIRSQRSVQEVVDSSGCNLFTFVVDSSPPLPNEYYVDHPYTVKSDYSDLPDRLVQALEGDYTADEEGRVYVVNHEGLLVRVEGLPESFSVVYNGTPLEPARKLSATNEPVRIEHSRDLLVKVAGGKPDEFSVKFNGQELADSAARRRLADEPIRIEHEDDVLVKVGGRPDQFSVVFNGQELSDTAAKRRLAADEPVRIEQGDKLLVKVAGRPDQFSVVFNGQELAGPASRRRLAADEPVRIEYGKDVLVEVGGRPDQFSVIVNGQELAGTAARRRLAADEPVRIEQGEDLLVQVGGRPDEFSVVFNGQELVGSSGRRLDAAAEAIRIESGSEILVKTGSTPDEKKNGKELPAARRLGGDEPVRIEHGQDLLVKVAGRPDQFSVVFNGQELA